MLQPIVGRDSKGRMLPGHSASNGAQPYRYAARAALLEQELTTKQILDLNDDDEALFKRPFIDSVVIRRMARAIKKIEPQNCADVERAAEAHLDRAEGRVGQSLEVTAKISIIDIVLAMGKPEESRGVVIENDTLES